MGMLVSMQMLVFMFSFHINTSLPKIWNPVMHSYETQLSPLNRLSQDYQKRLKQQEREERSFGCYYKALDRRPMGISS